MHNNNILLESETDQAYRDYACASAQVFVHLAKGDRVWVSTTWASNMFSNVLRKPSFAGAFIRE